MNPKLIHKLLKIPQRETIWQCTVRRAPLWITPPKQPAYRPFILLVIDQVSEMILKTEISNDRPTPQAVLDHLFQTMQGTLLSLRRQQRPARILMDDAGLAQACAPQLVELGIRCEARASLPQINAALNELEAQANHRDPVPGLLSILGASVPMVAELFAAAADFYRLSPWKFLDNEYPIEVRYPPTGPARYALVLGSGGEFFGLSLYESLADMDEMFSLASPEERTSRRIFWLSLILDEPQMMSIADLDAMEQYAWPLAGERAYPLAMKLSSERDQPHLPSASELSWLAAALRAIPGFVSEHLRPEHGMPHQSAQASFTLPNVHGNQQIALRFPASAAPAGQPVGQTQDPELEAYIENWHWDEKSHEYARQMGAFLFEFFDYLEDQNLSESTIRKHENNCWCIGVLESQYGLHDTFTPAVFLGGPAFISEFARKVSDSEYAISSYKATWRKLEKYISSLGYTNPNKKKA